MTFPIRNLPVVQNWDCHTCGDCCRELEAVISEEEKLRIESLPLAGDTEIGAGPWFGRKGSMHTLKHRPEGGCVFLTSQNHCRLHERFGEDVKPFACRFFPFLLLPAGDHWRVGVRFSCPSVVDNLGRSLTSYDKDLVHLAHLLEKHVGRTGDSAPPPELQPGQQAEWPAVLRLVDTLVEIIKDPGDRIERRLRKCLALANVCRHATFDSLSGNRLDEFLKLIRGTLDDEVPRDPTTLAPPGWIGRVLFRTLLAVFARKDWGRYQGTVPRTRFARMRAGWRFIRGNGPVPHVNRFLAETTFAEVETRTGRNPPEVDALLERYYLIKFYSLQFCGPPNFAQSVWGGVESLVLTFPMILWLARASNEPTPQGAVRKAILLVDDHFGGNPLLGYRHNRFFIRTLASRRELEKLIAWYNR